MKNIIGKPVTGADFFGRGRELLELKQISKDEHVLLLAPRRVGKTSLLCALASAATDDATLAGIYVSVAAAKDETNFIDLVLGEIYASKEGKHLKPNALANWLKRQSRRVKGGKLGPVGVEVESASHDWQDEANHAFSDILKAKPTWLLLIDELPIFVLTIARNDPTGQRVRTFLQWFRDLRQLPKANTKLRFVLAGSVGLDSVTRRHGLTDTINDLRDWRLGPYDALTADQFLAELARSYRLEVGRDLRRQICDQAEWLIPYHLQVIFSALRGQAKGTVPTETHLRNVIDELLGQKLYFSSWEERLRGALGSPEDGHARALLALCAHDPRGVSTTSLQLCLSKAVPDPGERQKLVGWLLEVLQNDGYLIEHAGRWRFRSGLLRQYWKRNVP